MTIRPLTSADIDALLDFFGRLSDRDRTLIREDLSDRDAIAALAGRELHWIDTDTDADGSDIAGYVAVKRLPGWSDHVGELRLVVHPDRRGSGRGRMLAEHAVAQALRAGIGKVVVELVADQDGAIALFTGLGFTGEALLTDHIRDRDGTLHDLVVLAHRAEEGWSALQAIGLGDAAGA